jgi:hypothetical protein
LGGGPPPPASEVPLTLSESLYGYVRGAGGGGAGGEGGCNLHIIEHCTGCHILATGAAPLTYGKARHACCSRVAPIRARCFNSKRTSFHVAIELEHVESVDLRSEIRKADAVLPVFARAGQRGDTLKRVVRGAAGVVCCFESGCNTS